MSVAINAQTHKLVTYVVASCGPSVQNNSNKVVGTLGEPAIGENSNQSNKIWSGFWYTIPNETGLMSPVLLTPPNNAQFVILNPVLEWQAVQDATSYILQVSRNIEFTDLIVNYETNLTAYLLENLNNSTIYYWRVKAKNAEDESSWSAIWNFKTLPVPLGIPTLLDPINNMTDVPINPNFQWTSVQNATSYDIEVYISATNQLILNTSTEHNFYADANLNYITNYKWRVRAKNDEQTGNWTGFNTFTTTEAPPFTVTIGNKSTCSGTAIYLGSDLEIEGGSGNFSYTWTPSNLLDNSTIANPKFINPTTTTNFTLKVKDNISGTIVEKTITVTVANSAPKAVVQSFLTRKESLGSFDLNTTVSNRSGTEPFLDLWHNSNYEELESSIVDPPKGLTKYYYKIQDATGCQSNFKRLMVYTVSGRDISEEDIQLSSNLTFAVFATPNPADKYLELVVLLEQNEDITVKISDIVGNTLHTESINSHSTEITQQIDVESLASGTYFIYVQTSNDIAVHKFVKI